MKVVYEGPSDVYISPAGREYRRGVTVDVPKAEVEALPAPVEGKFVFDDFTGGERWVPPPAFQHRFRVEAPVVTVPDAEPKPTRKTRAQEEE